MAWDPSYFGNDKSAFMVGIGYELAKNRYNISGSNDDILRYGNLIYRHMSYEFLVPDDEVVILYRGQEILRLDRCRVKLYPLSLSEEEADKANSLICLIDEF